MKRIVICADGTWNFRDQAGDGTKTRRPSNVTKVARAIRTRAAGTDQVVFYHEGIGTGGVLDKYSGGVLGSGIEKNIRELYRSIVYNYESGDELFFFGFSRGAFTVRTLAGFMHAVGLIAKDDDYWVPELYDCYEKGALSTGSARPAVFQKLRSGARPCPPIKFIGVWDTVGALGAPGVFGQVFNKDRYKYHDVSLNEHILNAFQALAIDERRKPFAPSIWDRPPSWSGTLAQAWFPGVHTDVGGGSTPDGLANEALHWLVEKAEKCGLVFNDEFLNYYTPCFNSVLHDSMSAKYKMFGPHIRAIGIQSGEERLHRSAIDRHNLVECAYRPANLEEYLIRNDSAAPYDTTRIPRGTPCPPIAVTSAQKGERIET